MKKYILRIGEDPCNYECGMKYYQCVDAPYWQLSERTLGQLPELEESLQAAYHRGLNEMWDIVRHLWENGTIDFSCDLSWSVEKVLEEYEKQKNAIKIGDEVKFNHNDIKATVMDQSDKEDTWWLYTENGCIEEWQDAYFCKTGRTFSQIEEVLKAMQEGTES